MAFRVWRLAFGVSRSAFDDRRADPVTSHLSALSIAVSPSPPFDPARSRRPVLRSFSEGGSRRFPRAVRTTSTATQTKTTRASQALVHFAVFSALSTLEISFFEVVGLSVQSRDLCNGYYSL
jgi:hypothetical protein